MRCYECGGEGDLIIEVEGNLRFLCRWCYYRPDECSHESIVMNLTEPLAGPAVSEMVGICTTCQTARELPSLTGNPQELFKAGRDIDAYVAKFNDKWYISRKVPCTEVDDGWPDEPFTVGPLTES